MLDICEFYNPNELMCDAGSYTCSVQCTNKQSMDCLWAQDHKRFLKEALRHEQSDEQNPSDGLAE